MTAPASSLRPPLAARRHGAIAEASARWRGVCGLSTRGPVVLAASGGPDSTALLVLGAVLADRHPELRPVAVHVHHHLRGADADADAATAADAAARLALPFMRLDVHPAEQPGNRLAVARRLRYAALAATAVAHGASAVVAAHHADDQLEKLLVRVAAGAGASGLRAMRWRRRLAPGIALARPLLGLRKAALLELCAAAGVPWRHDATNHVHDRQRGRLRAILPDLETALPGLVDGAAAAAEAADAAHRALRRELARCFGPASARSWTRASLRPLARAALAAGLRRAAADAGGAGRNGGRAALLRAADAIRDDDSRPRRFRLPQGLEIVVEAQRVHLHRTTPA